MGNFFSRETIVTVPDKNVMMEIVDRIVNLESKIKKGEHLTRVQEMEKKELEKVARAMKRVQQASINRLGSLVTGSYVPYQPEGYENAIEH
tara:strand:- start:27 stop:299 length:273 start_codon:yes stop_codon:yes gene_type:complete